MTERLEEAPGEGIRRDRPVSIVFEGRKVAAFEGDSVGSALAAAGVTITARSFKYHRPRGLLCMTGSCANCLMQVDGIPNVRACIEPVRDGMRVERQNAWPSAGRDIHGWLNTFSFMMPPGFYYKVFQRPRWAWHMVEPFIRSKAGLGKVPRDEDHALARGREPPLRRARDRRRFGRARRGRRGGRGGSRRRSCSSSGPRRAPSRGRSHAAVDAGVRAS